jgi:hypothetical protein
MILSLLLLTFMVALATAQFSVTQKNIQSANYFLSYSDLHACAESGVDLALHDLKYTLTANGGKIGTVNWTTANDLGRDGIAGTYDDGEGDGIPTIGEPNVAPVSMGPSSVGARLAVWVGDTATPDVYRVVATASNADATATVDTYTRKNIITIPKVGAVFVDPSVALDLKGNSFTIDGRDYNPDGTISAGAPVPGIATTVGAPPGMNKIALLAQIPVEAYDQVIGSGGNPSLGENSSFDLHTIFDTFKAIATQSLPGGTYSDPDMGNSAADDYRITYINSDVHFSGKGQGAGILVVEGSVTISGQFDFDGLVLVKGDVRLSGGGSKTHVYGSLMVEQSITAVDTGSDLSVSGSADIRFSSEVLNKVSTQLPLSYSILYYDDK